MASRSRVPAVTRSAEVLRLLAGIHRPLTVTAIAQETGLPRTSVQGICETLAREQMLARGVDGSYWLGPRVAALGGISRLSERHALRFGVLVPNLENAYYAALLRAAEETARATGSELFIRAADDDSARQREQWQLLLDDLVDVILIDGVDTHGFDDLVVRSRQAGVPVVAMGTRIDDVDAAVTSDNTQAGRLAGHELAERVRPGSKVAIVDGLRKNANADRVAGFRDALRDHPEVTVVAHEYGLHDDVASGRAAARRVLSAHPEVAGIFAVCDPIALGVAAHLTGRDRWLPITAVDGRASAVEQIRAGLPIVATAAQDPVRLIRAAMDLGRELHDDKRPPQRVLLMPVRLISAANAAGYQPWG